MMETWAATLHVPSAPQAGLSRFIDVTAARPFSCICHELLLINEQSSYFTLKNHRRLQFSFVDFRSC